MNNRNTYSNTLLISCISDEKTVFGYFSSNVLNLSFNSNYLISSPSPTILNDRKKTNNIQCEN